MSLVFFVVLLGDLVCLSTFNDESLVRKLDSVVVDDDNLDASSPS
jgi:hypothetical protein